MQKHFKHMSKGTIGICLRVVVCPMIGDLMIHVHCKADNGTGAAIYMDQGWVGLIVICNCN